jgi:hypothetical protein
LSWSLARPSRACWFPRRDVAIVAFPPTHGYSALARRLTACRVSLWSLPGSPDLSLARPTPGLLASPTRSPSSFGQLTVVVGHRPPSLLVCSSTLVRVLSVHLLFPHRVNPKRERNCGRPKPDRFPMLSLRLRVLHPSTRHIDSLLGPCCKTGQSISHDQYPPG